MAVIELWMERWEAWILGVTQETMDSVSLGFSFLICR